MEFKKVGETYTNSKFAQTKTHRLKSNFISKDVFVGDDFLRINDIEIKIFTEYKNLSLYTITETFHILGCDRLCALLLNSKTLNLNK